MLAQDGKGCQPAGSDRAALLPCPGGASLLYSGVVKSKSPEKVIAVNRKAFHDYHVEESVEAGLALTGSEIKSIRLGRVNLREAYARVEHGEAWLLKMHVAPYEAGDRFTAQEPTRRRKLLLHRQQIVWLLSKAREKGYTLIPLKLYLKNDRAKIELGLARGKKQYDKREAIARRDADREIERATKVQ
ncbi:MAG: SsrA-binding protein SmpB [Chloroflexi bacterium]|nr:SsrA-binding protein SmpB [Chloroflexota bacterium]